MQYRRVFVPGGQYFFTLVTERRRKIFYEDNSVKLLRQAFRHVVLKRPFVVNAAVILPDHLHCIWTLPPDDSDFATRWRLIKTWFTKHCDERLRTTSDDNRLRRGESAIWQHRYWEHLLRDETDFHKHVDYIHYNPVKHGLVTKPLDWPYSSFHRYVEKGWLPENWGISEPDFPDGIGRE